MTNGEFQAKVRVAEVLQKLATEPLESEYYRGYLRGLQRAYHGHRFGTESEHEQWLDCSTTTMM